MLYNEISNEPVERRKNFYPYVTWNDAFSNDEIDNIIRMSEKEPLNDGKTVTNKNIEYYRKSKVRFINKRENTNSEWIFDRFNRVITHINNQFYGFNINGYSFFQYTVYESDVNGMYNWHMDTIMGDNTTREFDEIRKLSLVMLLNEPGKDFTGGEFQINEGIEEKPLNIDMRKGRMVIFPSFMIHRVRPVLTGVRKSIVLWVEGPKFI